MSEDGPYNLCQEAAVRLHNRTLRPLEWFHLAAIHGPLEYHIHDDFYEDDGTAIQPAGPVEAPELFPFPKIADWLTDLPMLLDIASVQWFVRSNVLDAVRPFSSTVMTEIISRYSRTQNPWFRYRLMELAGGTVGASAREWYRSALGNLPPQDRISALHAGHLCLTPEEGCELAIAVLRELRPQELQRAALVLAHFRSPVALDWIESHVCEPILESWGRISAASGLDWNRAVRWLTSGRPLSLVALDALVAYCGPRQGDAPMFRKMKLHLPDCPSPADIQSHLLDYARRDPSPRVKKAVLYLQSNLQQLRGSTETS